MLDVHAWQCALVADDPTEGELHLRELLVEALTPPLQKEQILH